MINVNDEIIAAYDISTTQYDKIKIGDKEYPINNVQYDDDCYDNGNIFGTAIARTLDFEIENIVDLEKKEFEYLTGIKINDRIHYISLGNFITIDVEPGDTTAINKVTAMDYMLKSNIPYETKLNYSSLKVTILDVVKEACQNAGIELATEKFANNSFIVDSNQFEPDAIIRQVFQAVAGISGSFAKIKADNKLYFITPKIIDSTIYKVNDIHKMPIKKLIQSKVKNISDGLKVATIENKSFLEKQSDYTDLVLKRNTHPINVVSIGMSQVEGENATLRDEESIAIDGENTLTINDNPFAYTQEKRKELIPALYETVRGFSYTAYELSGQCKPFWETGDSILIVDSNQKIIPSFLFRFTFKSPNGLESEMSAPSIIKSTVNYQNLPSDLERLARTEIIVNKHEGEINEITEKQNEQQKQLAQLKITTDGIEALVKNSIDITNTITGINPITLTECMAGEIQYLSIRGNENVFTSLYPDDNLYPNDNLLPYGDESCIYITNVETGIIKKYDLKLDYPLLSYDEDTFDRFIYDASVDTEQAGQYIAKVIRQVGIRDDGTLYKLPLEKIVAVDIKIELLEGTNIIDLSYPSITGLTATYIRINQYTKIFATTYEVNSLIKQLADELSLAVTQGNIISALNLAVKNDLGILEMIANHLSIQSDYTTLTPDGHFTTTSGNIGSFDISKDGLKKEIDGTYNYDYIDVITTLEYIKENISLPSALLELYDVDDDGNIDVTDTVRMINIIKGTQQNNKKIKGTVEINANNASETFSVKVDDIVKTVIGLFNIYSYAIRCSNLYVGEYDQTYGKFQGIQFNKETKQMWITRGNKRIQIGMDDYDRCVFQMYDGERSSGTAVFPDANVEAVDFIAGGGRCMHGRALNHYYSVDWGTTLTFFVDNVNVGSLSDSRLKTDIEPISDKLLKAIKEVELKQFKLFNRYGRKSFGIIAQELISAFKLNGLNIWEFDLISEAQYELNDKTLYYIVDYEQFLILKSKCYELEIKDLNERVEKIEKILGGNNG